MISPTVVVQPPRTIQTGTNDIFNLAGQWADSFRFGHAVHASLLAPKAQPTNAPLPKDQGLSLKERVMIGRLLTTDSQRTRLRLASQLQQRGLSTHILASLMKQIEDAPPNTTDREGMLHYDIDSTVACLAAFGEDAKQVLKDTTKNGSPIVQKIAAARALLLIAAQKTRQYALPRDAGSSAWILLNALTTIENVHARIDQQLLWQSAQNYISTGLSGTPTLSTSETGSRIYIDFAVKELERIFRHDQVTFTSLYANDDRITPFQKCLLFMAYVRATRGQTDTASLTDYYIDHDGPEANSPESLLINQIIFNELSRDPQTFARLPISAGFLTDPRMNLDGVPFKYAAAVVLWQNDDCCRDVCAKIITDELRERTNYLEWDDSLSDTAFINATRLGGPSAVSLIERVLGNTSWPNSEQAVKMAVWLLKWEPDNQTAINIVTIYLEDIIAAKADHSKIETVLNAIAHHTSTAFEVMAKWAHKKHPTHSMMSVIKRLSRERQRRLSNTPIHYFDHLPPH